jgi:hypothetical protein
MIRSSHQKNTCSPVGSPPGWSGTIGSDSAVLDQTDAGTICTDNALKCPIVSAPGRFGTLRPGKAGPKGVRHAVVETKFGFVVQPVEGRPAQSVSRAGRKRALRRQR